MISSAYGSPFGVLDALDDLEWDLYEKYTAQDTAENLVHNFEPSHIYRALDLAASDPRFELAQQSGWLQQVRDAVTELL